MLNTLLEQPDLPEGDLGLGIQVQQKNLYESREQWEDGVNSIDVSPQKTVFKGVSEVINKHLKASALVFGTGSLLIGAAASKRIFAR